MLHCISTLQHSLLLSVFYIRVEIIWYCCRTTYLSFLLFLLFLYLLCYENITWMFINICYLLILDYSALRFTAYPIIQYKKTQAFNLSQEYRDIVLFSLKWLYQQINSFARHIWCMEVALNVLNRLFNAKWKERRRRCHKRFIIF